MVHTSLDGYYIEGLDEEEYESDQSLITLREGASAARVCSDGGVVSLGPATFTSLNSLAIRSAIESTSVMMWLQNARVVCLGKSTETQ